MKDFYFKYRGWLFVPAALIMLILAKPTLISLITGFVLVGFGEGIRIWAVGYSGVTTRDKKLKAPRLITAGPYGYIRNPLYLGNLISWLGFSIACAGNAPFWAQSTIILSVLLSYAIIYGKVIPLEENFLRETFGEPYEQYLEEVPRLCPNFKYYSQPEGVFNRAVITSAEIHTIIMLLIIIVLILLKYFGLIPGIY
ncbi:MAG: methyltransferase family protein [Vulcanimicrobiota bacterium]